MRKNNNVISFGLAISICSIIGFGGNMALNAAPAKSTGQKIIPAPVNYYADISNGGKGMFGGMGNIPFLKMESNSNFGDAFHGLGGLKADLAIKHKDFPNNINAAQSIPKSMKLGSVINLIPSLPKDPTPPRKYDDDKTYPKEQIKNKDYKFSYYWGCGANLKPGNVKTIQIKNGNISGAMTGLSSRSDPAQNQAFAQNASKWPNHKEKNSIPAGASMVATHTISGANIPVGMAVNFDTPLNFMGDLGLKSSGAKEGVITLNWNAVSGAKAYYFNAFGMNENEIIMWSASDVPETGAGLLNYLTNAKITQYLGEKAILPPSQTKCEIPNGIFKNSMMVMVRGIGYGEEKETVFPARPTDPKVTWVQQYTTQIRNKTMDYHMVGMPSMNDAMKGAKMNEPALTPEEQAKKDCEKQKAENANIGSALGGALGGSLGGALGRKIGKSKSKCPN